MSSTKLVEHVRTPDHDIHKNTHISHFHSLVSAYETTGVSINDLIEEIQEAITDAKQAGNSIVVNSQSGYMFFVVHPSGQFDLCVAVDRLEFVPDENKNPYCYKQSRFKGELLACGLEPGHKGDCDFVIANPIPNEEQK